MLLDVNHCTSVLYIYKQYAAAGACSARNLSRHFWAACGSYRVLYLQMKIKTHDGVVKSNRKRKRNS